MAAATNAPVEAFFVFCVQRLQSGENVLSIPAVIMDAVTISGMEILVNALKGFTGLHLDLQYQSTSADWSITHPGFPVQSTGPMMQPECPQGPIGSGRIHRKMNRKAGRKCPPRPMNCWCFFLEEQHRLLKGEHPELTTQQICKLIVK